MPKKEIAPVEEENTDFSKEAFMRQVEKMRPDLVYPESWSSETRAKAADLVKPEQTRRRMFGIIPLKCRGDKCPLSEVCPLLAENLAPVGSSCPIEVSIISELQQAYMFELGVNPANMIEVAMVRDLINQEVLQHRATWLLSIEHFIQENVVGVSPDGEVIKQKQLHLAVELEDKLQKRKKEIRNQLLATREARAKAGQGSIDNAQAIANLVSEARKIERTKADFLLEKAGIKRTDDYVIDAEVVDEEDAA
jgi:hypothetical protein